MNDKSLFREMAKKVHPDTQSEFASGSKMRQVIENKNNPYVLLNLARQWGLNINGSFDSSAFDKKAENFSENVYNAVVGAIIRHAMPKGRLLRGVIVGIRRISKGHWKGGREFKVYDFENNQIWRLKSIVEKPFDSIVGMADDSVVNEGIQKFEFSDMVKKDRKIKKQIIANDNFERIGLRNNMNYVSLGMKVLVRYRNVTRWETLIRTTLKSVYIRCYGYKNDERRIDVRSIIEAK